EQRARCRLAAVHAGDCARQAMDLMFRHGGSTSFKTERRLAEVWRDLQVGGPAAALPPGWDPIRGPPFPRVATRPAPAPASAARACAGRPTTAAPPGASKGWEKTPKAQCKQGGPEKTTRTPVRRKGPRK